MSNFEFGILQGTVLGPILFAMYVNSSLFISFTDATVLTYEHQTWKEVERVIENDLERIKF